MKTASTETWESQKKSRVDDHLTWSNHALTVPKGGHATRYSLYSVLKSLLALTDFWRYPFFFSLSAFSSPHLNSKKKEKETAHAPARKKKKGEKKGVGKHCNFNLVHPTSATLRNDRRKWSSTKSENKLTFFFFALSLSCAANKSKGKEFISPLFCVSKYQYERKGISAMRCCRSTWLGNSWSAKFTAFWWHLLT